jgi:hypothetical protein
MADDELWTETQSKGNQSTDLGRGAKIKDLHDRLLKQGVDEKTGAPLEPKWHLDDEQLDLAAYEQLILTLPNSEQFLRSRERETFGYVASKCGFSKRRQQEIYAGVTKGVPREQFEEELIESAEQVDELEGWLEKAGEKKKGVKGVKGGAFKKRYFHLADSQMEYLEKPGGKSKGTIDLTNATACEAAGPENPLTFFVVLPTRRFELKSADPFEAQRWIEVLSRVISQNQEAKEGHLEKQGAKNKSFKMRWFRILGTKMYYYKNPGDDKPAGVIDLEGATSCRKSADEADEREFSIGIDGRNYVLRATDRVDRDGWIADISRRCPALEGMDGFLIRYGKRGKKGQERWFKLLGKRLLFFKQPGAKSEDGEIPLEFAKSCRPHAGSEDDTEFEIELPKSTFRMKAATPEACREWITAISEAITSGADDGDDAAADYDDAEMPNTHLMCHRWQLLKEKNPQDDFDSVGDFLVWRKRQLVILGSGLHHQIDHLQEYLQSTPGGGQSPMVPTEATLDKAKKALNTISNIIKSSNYELAAWGGKEDTEWSKRLNDIERTLDAAFESDEQVPLSEWGEGEVPSFICHYPLHLGSFFIERLLRKACFEEEDFGGGLDFQRDNVDELLRHMGSRLKFPEGLHDVSFACALVEQYKNVIAQDQDGQEVVEVLAEEIERIDLDCPALNTTAAEVCLLHVQKFSMSTLSSYHDLADSTYIAHFVQVFAEIMRLRKQMVETIQQRMEKQIWDSVDKRYTTFWEGAIEAVQEKVAGGPQYDDEGERLPPPVIDPATLNPLEVLQNFCDFMSAEIDQEVGEYAAYIGTCMENSDDAGMTVVRSIAARLNKDIRDAFATVEEMTEMVMICWGSLRDLEVKLVDVMLSCGKEGKDAKLLNVDDALVKVAYGWMDEKEKQFNERMQNMIDMETWTPFDDDATFAACGVDMVSMLISVAQQYFAAELPVSAKITVNAQGRPVWDAAEGDAAAGGTTEKAAIRILADKFGFVLQKFGRKVLQQCGEEPRPPWRSADKKGMRGRATTMISSNLGKGLGKGLTGLSKIRQGDEGEEEEEQEEEEVEESEPAGGVDIEGMCIRMATINYVADHCKDMCNELVIGCQQNMFKADWVPKALEERELELKRMVRSLADTCSASIVYVSLNSQLYEKVYKPLPSKAPLSGSAVFDELEGFLETVMMTVPDECYLDFKRASDTEAEDVALRVIIREQRRPKIGAVLGTAINSCRGANLIELTVEDEETEISEVQQGTVAADMHELAEYFVAGGEGISDEVAQKVTEKLGETWENVKREATDAKYSGKTAKELDKEAGKDLGVPDSIGGAAAALTGGVGGLTKGLGASMGLAKKKDDGEFTASGFFDSDEEDGDDAAGGLATVADNLGGLASVGVTGLAAGLSSGLDVSSAVGGKLMTGMTDTALGFASEIEELEFDAELREEVKVTIKARSRYTYKVRVQQMMGPVIFNFTIAKWDINFSVKFLPDSGGDWDKVEQQLRELFEKTSSDGDSIDQEGVASIQKEMGVDKDLQDAEMEAAMVEMGAEASGKVSFDQLLGWWRKQWGEIEGWEDGVREAGSMKGMYAPTEDGTLQLVWDNSRSLMTGRDVEFKVQLLADTMAEAMAMHDEGPIDEDEIEARTQIKSKRGRFGTLGKMGTGRMGNMAKQAGRYALCCVASRRVAFYLFCACLAELMFDWLASPLQQDEGHSCSSHSCSSREDNCSSKRCHNP